MPQVLAIDLDGLTVSLEADYIFTNSTWLYSGWTIRQPFIRGDVDPNGSIDLADAIATLAHLFVPGTSAHPCPDTLDSNDDAELDVGDVVFLLAALFVPGAAPLPEPTSCGVDPTPDVLNCPEFTVCP